MNRRTFIAKASKYGGILVTGITLGDALVTKVIAPIAQRYLQAPTIPTATWDAAVDLFGLGRSRISILPASDNPKVSPRLDIFDENARIETYDDLFKYYSRATVHASDVFNPFLRPGYSSDKFDHIVDYETVSKAIAVDTNHTVIALGTPTSNRLIREMMSYESLPDTADGHIHHNAMDDFITIPIHFELERDKILKNGNLKDKFYRPRDKEGRPTRDTIPNWGLVDMDGVTILPATDDGILLEDFLVISVIPNFTTPDTVDRDIPLICMGGTHAVGTLAIKKLFESGTCLTDLQSRLQELHNPRFWQAVFRVRLFAESDAVESIHLEKNMVGEVKVDKHGLGLYADKYMRRS